MIRGGLEFADRKCSRCGWHHQMDAFAIGELAKVVDLGSGRHGHTGAISEIGVVSGWGWVRVAFGDGYAHPYAPCQLEHDPFESPPKRRRSSDRYHTLDHEVACPYCGAAIGQACRSKAGIAVAYHLARVHLAERLRNPTRREK